MQIRCSGVGRVPRAQVPDLGQLVADIDVALFANQHPEAGALTAALPSDFEALKSNSYRRLYMKRALRPAHRRP